jgi:hypothetical protein
MQKGCLDTQKEVALSLLIISMMPFMLHFCFNQIGISAPVRYNMAVFKNLGWWSYGNIATGYPKGICISDITWYYGNGMIVANYTTLY